MRETIRPKSSLRNYFFNQLSLIASPFKNYKRRFKFDIVIHKPTRKKNHAEVNYINHLTGKTIEIIWNYQIKEPVNDKQLQDHEVPSTALYGIPASSSPKSAETELER